MYVININTNILEIILNILFNIIKKKLITILHLKYVYIMDTLVVTVLNIILEKTEKIQKLKLVNKKLNEVVEQYILNKFLFDNKNPSGTIYKEIFATMSKNTSEYLDKLENSRYSLEEFGCAPFRNNFTHRVQMCPFRYDITQRVQP